MVVDDDKTFTSLLKTIFEMEGYQVVAVSRPEEVLPMARHVMPALLLMDVHAGRGNTLNVLRELRADPALNGMAIVMDSGLDCSAECLEAGANAFVLKPFRPTELIELVEQVLSQHNQDATEPCTGSQ